MTLKSYLIMMSIMTSVCWLAWTYVIFIIDPFTTNWIGLTLFYTSLFLSLIGTATILGFLVRFVLLRQKLAFRAAREAFRQSFLFSLLVIISLYLLSRGLFTWLNLVFLVLALSVLEFFMLSYKNTPKHIAHNMEHKTHNT